MNKPPDSDPPGDSDPPVLKPKLPGTQVPLVPALVIAGLAMFLVVPKVWKDR